MENIGLNEVSVENSKGERLLTGFGIAVALFILLGYALLQVREGEPEGAWNDNHQVSYLQQRDHLTLGWYNVDTIYTYKGGFIDLNDRMDDTSWHIWRVEVKKPANQSIKN